MSYSRFYQSALSDHLAKLLVGIILIASALLIIRPVWAGNDHIYDVHITAVVEPGEGEALVTIDIPRSHLINSMRFTMPESQYSMVDGDGKLTREGSTLTWDPPNAAAQLSYRVQLNERKGGSDTDPVYSRFVGSDWALIRGDDLVPSVSTSTVKRASKPESSTNLTFILPKSWRTAVGGWERLNQEKLAGKNQITFRIDNPERLFDRPTGWFALGKLGTRREQIADTLFYVGAPRGSEMERLTTLAVVTGVLPKLQALVDTPPAYLTLVSAGEPMWRGGLSGPNSLYLHEDRPLISENGTSTLVHELFHSVTRIRGKADNDDWIAEGLAEFYSFDALFRAGLLTPQRRQLVIEKLRAWGMDVKSFRKEKSRGEVTAAAAVWFAQLHAAFGADADTVLDELVKELARSRKVSTAALVQAIKRRASRNKAITELLEDPRLQPDE